MKKFIGLGIIAALMLIFSVSFADETVTTYDEHWGVTGHEKTEGGKTTVYDKYWNPVGHREVDGNKVRTYDKYWNPTGYEKRDSRSGNKTYHGKGR